MKRKINTRRDNSPIFEQRVFYLTPYIVAKRKIESRHKTQTLTTDVSAVGELLEKLEITLKELF